MLLPGQIFPHVPCVWKSGENPGSHIPFIKQPFENGAPDQLGKLTSLAMRRNQPPSACESADGSVLLRGNSSSGFTLRFSVWAEFETCCGYLIHFLCSVCGGKKNRCLTHILTWECSAASCRAEPVFLHPTQLPKQNCRKGQIPESTPNATPLQMIPLSRSSAHQLWLF